MQTPRERLEHLANFLLQLDETKFDIDGWGTRHVCGTIACAGGWATQLPTFIEQGLTSVAGTLTPLYTTSAGQRYTHFHALQEFFALSRIATAYIFGVSSYGYPTSVTPKDVVKHINKVLAGTTT